MSCIPVAQSYNFSHMAFPGTLMEYPTLDKGLKIFLGLFVALTAIIGNVLVITIVVRFKRMRTTTNYFLVNLAISDLLVACVPIWIHVVDSVNELWVFGGFLCKFNPFLQITAMCASMFTLLVIAADRFFAIMFPMKSRVTKRRVSVILIVVWLIALSIASPLLFFYTYYERIWSDLKETICEEIWPMKEISDGNCDKGLAAKKSYWIVVCAILNWTPMVFMLVTYTFIVIKLRNHKIMPKLGAMAKSSIQERSKRRVVTMLFSVVVVFIVCSVPFQSLKIYFLYTQGDRNYKLPIWYNTLDFAAVLLMYSNSAINPIIYGGLNENFRKGFKDLVNGRGTTRTGGDTEFSKGGSVRTRASVISRGVNCGGSLKRYRDEGPVKEGDIPACNNITAIAEEGETE